MTVSCCLSYVRSRRFFHPLRAPGERNEMCRLKCFSEVARQRGILKRQVFAASGTAYCGQTLDLTCCFVHSGSMLSLLFHACFFCEHRKIYCRFSTTGSESSTKPLHFYMCDTHPYCYCRCSVYIPKFSVFFMFFFVRADV